MAEALRRLENTIAAWEKAAERTKGLGLESIADIALSGGMVWVLEVSTKSSSPRLHPGPCSLPDVLDSLKGAAFLQSAPYMNVQDGQTYQALILVVPNK